MSINYISDAAVQCVGKKTWRNSHDAKAAARRTMATGGSAMNAYRCIHCGHWHVGHPTPWRRRQASEQMRDVG